MKNKIFIAIFIIMGLCVFSQAAVDIFDPLYEDIRIWEKIGLDANPFNDTTMIVGHTPTFRYGDEYRGKIAIGKNKQIYHIDCGCVFGKSLGCLRLDDLKEFYIPSLQPDRT